MVRTLEVLEKDKDGNAVAGDVITKDVSNSFVYAGSRLVTAIGSVTTLLSKQLTLFWLLIKIALRG